MLPRLLTRPSRCALAAAGRLMASRPSAAPFAAEFVDIDSKREEIKAKIQPIIADKSNRLFAVVYAHNRQFKVTQGDIINLNQNSVLDVGQQIQLEKVLLVGGRDFTLFGRPLLDPSHVKVFATVIEKSVTSPDVNYVKFSGKKVTRLNWLSNEFTVLRINDIVVEEEALTN